MPVIRSKDCTEVEFSKNGEEMLEIFQSAPNDPNIFQEFAFMDIREDYLRYSILMIQMNYLYQYSPQQYFSSMGYQPDYMHLSPPGLQAPPKMGGGYIPQNYPAAQQPQYQQQTNMSGYFPANNQINAFRPGGAAQQQAPAGMMGQEAAQNGAASIGALTKGFNNMMISPGFAEGGNADYLRNNYKKSYKSAG